MTNNLPSVESSNATNNDNNDTTNTSTCKAMHRHGPPPEGLECLVTMEDISLENYVEYQCYPSLEWKAAKIEESVVQELLQTQFQTYIQRVKETDCNSELRRLLQKGPPIYISDPYGLPLQNNDNNNENNATKNDKEQNDGESNGNTVQQSQQDKETAMADTHICKLWYSSDNMERSSKLMGAVDGIERQQLWDELKQFLVITNNNDTDDKNDGVDGNVETTNND